MVQGVVASATGDTFRVCPRLRLPDTPHLDGDVSRTGIEIRGDALVVSWSDGTTLALGMDPAPDAWESGILTVDPATDGLDGTIADGPDLALCGDVPVAAGEEAPFRWAVALSEEALAEALAAADPLADAADTRADFGDACEPGALCRFGAANLYAARASSLGGAVPADLTGQSVTNGFPQLYPRDALQVARALHVLGRDAEAWEIVRAWLAIAGGQPGEWHARYDALGRGVDAGSGAAYDTPEWDAQAYLAVMVERLGPDGLDAAERTALLEGLDFLVDAQDENGLFWEGGIVEWPGYLPPTAMIAWSGLDAGARLADGWGEPARAAAYRAAAGRIRGGLWDVYDADRDTLIDVRATGSGWDTSLLFGPVWGYPASPITDASYTFAPEEASLFGDGVRHFEGMAYGEDLFFFTTSAASRYATTLGDEQGAADLVAWMSRYANVYGLAPERVYSDGSGAATASPLSWCAAETGLAWLATETPTPMAIDGDVTSAEYRPTGAAVVDADGEPDDAGDPVALYAARDGADLLVGVSTAGTPSGSYTLFLSDASAGTGSVTLEASGGCQGCVELAVGAVALEARVGLAALGLSGDVHVVLETADGLLPPYGSLWTGAAPAEVPVRFEVAAGAVGSGQSVTLSGDHANLGAWAGDAVALSDDGTHGDDVAGDGVWTVTVTLPVDVRVEYKYLVGVPGDGSWAGVEFGGDNRALWVRDADGTGSVGVSETFGVRGSGVVDW